jgi:hypothetical protein
MSSHNNKKDPLGLRKADRPLKILGIATIVVVTVVVVMSFVTRDTTGATRGLTPREVVERFYNAVNSLDTHTLTHCVDPKGVTPFNNMIIADTMAGMIMLMEEATHGQDPDDRDRWVVSSPSEWISRGSPDLTPGETVFGILDFTIKHLSKTEYAVSYDYYRTGVPEDQIKTRRPFIISCRDICTLEKKSGDWIIAEIIQEAGD